MNINYLFPMLPNEINDKIKSFIPKDKYMRGTIYNIITKDDLSIIRQTRLIEIHTIHFLVTIIKYILQLSPKIVKSLYKSYNKYNSFQSFNKKHKIIFFNYETVIPDWQQYNIFEIILTEAYYYNENSIYLTNYTKEQIFNEYIDNINISPFFNYVYNLT
jgi:hypothetical protein